MPRRASVLVSSESSGSGRWFVIASLSTLAAVATAAIVMGTARREPMKASAAPPAVQVVEIADDRSADFIQTVAMSHVAPARTYEEPPVVAAADAPSKGATARSRPVVKPAQKPIEVAVLPPVRMADVAQALAAPPAKSERLHVKVDAIGVDLEVPTVADMRKLWPTPRQIGQKTNEIADRVASLFR